MLSQIKILKKKSHIYSCLIMAQFICIAGAWSVSLQEQRYFSLLSVKNRASQANSPWWET